jgi:hypothetical protein
MTGNDDSTWLLELFDEESAKAWIKWAKKERKKKGD